MNRHSSDLMAYLGKKLKKGTWENKQRVKWNNYKKNKVVQERKCNHGALLGSALGSIPVAVIVETTDLAESSYDQMGRRRGSLRGIWPSSAENQ